MKFIGSCKKCLHVQIHRDKPRFCVHCGSKYEAGDVSEYDPASGFSEEELRIRNVVREVLYELLREGASQVRPTPKNLVYGSREVRDSMKSNLETGR